MNKQIKDLLIQLDYDYIYNKDDNCHLFIKSNGESITFDYDYQFVAIDNNIREVTIDFDDINFNEL